MRPILFSLQGIPIHSYPAMLYLGIVLGIDAELYAAGAIGMDTSRTLAATLLLLMAALFGARLLFVITEWPRYRRTPRHILRFADGGASMYGGLFLAIPLSIPLTAACGIPFARFWDVVSVAMLVGLVVTRVGCLLNGCCAGRPSTGWLALELPDHRGVRARRIPNQLLDGAWGLVVLVGALWLWAERPFPGALLLYALGAYGAGRIVLEALRDARIGSAASACIGRSRSRSSRPRSRRSSSFPSAERRGEHRMIDWTFVLTPLLVLPIVLLFRFVGCGVLHGVSDDTSAPTDAYRAHILADADVIAYWRLIDAEGINSAKDEQDGWSGDYRATPLADEPPTPSAAGSKGATGQILTAQPSLLDTEPGLSGRNFDGGWVVVSDRFLSTPPNARLYTEEFTIEAWVSPKPSIVPGYEYTLFDAIGFYRKPLDTDQTSNGFSLFVDRQGRWQAVLSPHPDVLFSSPPLVPIIRSHVALSVQKTPAGQFQAQLFVNGAPSEDVSISFYSPPDGAFLLIGAANKNSDPSVDPPVPHQPFLGQIQEVVLYKKALDGADIYKHFKNFQS